MRFERLSEVAIGSFIGELRECLDNLIFGLVNILQFVKHQIFHRFDILAEQSHRRLRQVMGVCATQRLPA